MTNTHLDDAVPMSPPEPDPVMAAVEHVSQDAAAAATVAMALVGDRLGLYRAMAGAGPMTSATLAARANCSERYVREWLANQAAGGWISFEPENSTFTLDDAYGTVLGVEGSPVFLGGSLQIVSAMFAGLERLGSAFRTGEGIPWGDQHRDLHEGVGRFFAVACEPYLEDWLSQIDGAAEALSGGGAAIEIGCGRGSAAVALAQSFPAASIVGIDAHGPSIEIARAAAAQAGVAHRVSFTCADAATLPPGEHDVAFALDCLHDLGDPVATVRAVHSSLRADGAFLIVEPAAGDHLEDNLHAVGRMYYASSTAFCTPCALSQDGGWALGNQAGLQRLQDVLMQGGFSSVDIVARTPWQLVLVARP